ncbi:MAG TPA: Rieske (2Fe-2S) protein, partial [Polyangiaceae bacterium]
MKKQQRRVFLKVLAAGPLLGCGADPSAPSGGFGAGAAGGAAGTAGRPSVGGGGNPSFGGAGSSSVSGGGSSVSGGGNPSFGGAGSSVGSGGNPSVAGANVGGSAAGGRAGGSAAGASPAGMGGAVIDPNDPATPIGNVSLFPLGSFKVAGSIYFIGHDAGGLYAMSMQCTHAGCAVDMSGSQLLCPCHLSRFDHLGNVLAGPATKPL